MTKRRQSLTGPSTPDTDTLKKLNHVTAKKRKKKKPETSMNLWIILVLVITWISISVVIADPGWFVHDSPPVGEENNDIFSSEHLLTVKPRANTKPKPVTTVNASKDLHNNEKPKKKVETTPPSKPVRKPDTSDVESENFIPVHGTGRKPLTVPEKKEEIVKPQVKKTKPEKEPLTPPKKSDTVWFVQDVSLSGEDDDDLFSSEQLLVVKPKTKPKPKTTTPVKVSKDRHANEKSTTKVVGNKPKTSKPVKANTEGLESENFIPVNGPGRKPLAAVQNVDSVATPVKRNEAEKKPSAPTVNEELPCDNEKDIDCLMETEDLILVNKKKTTKPHPKPDTKPLIKRENVEVMKQEEKKVEPVKKVEEVQRSALHRRLLVNGKASKVPSKPVQQPLIYEIKEETEIGQEQDEDDILATEQDEDEQILRRIRRQATEDEIDGSGDRTGGFEEVQTINPALDYTMQFSTTLDKIETTLTEDKKANYSNEIERKLKGMFGATPGFKDVIVKNVRLDSNGRVTADWELVLSLSGATGSNQKQKKQHLLGFLTNTVVPEVNNLTVFDVNVYEPLEETVIEGLAQGLFDDVCKSDNPCKNGFVCTNEGTTSLCRHKCYHTKLIDQCQNGASCQLDQTFEPYCQCGNGFTGDKCQNQAAAAESDYSTPQLVGAGVAGAVAVTGAVCGAIYCALFRKKKEEDMEYSYFGDDDSSAPAFSDASSNLGISNYYIDRPSFSPAPLDIYNQNGNGAYA